ncbi:MAG: DNA methyltransferase [Candidatus Desulfovibrio kirbyi]|uniref:site-specific DNA-methyltransferase (adenine-specific) n=1 Tax=Candidatus Desulfovibrio kirbyi TaxID=2696086 RepID=A0A6L2R5Q1_9BACT|nr:MAG: DNA methyltransferase [Candidatus Desulfovibrio kirbyi]
MGSHIADFIQRWKASGGSEQANSQLFLAELCNALALPCPEPSKPVNEKNIYSFERKVYVPRGDGTNELKRLDLYRKGCFVLESKQGQDKAAPLSLPGLTASSAVKRGTRQWEDSMQRAKRQAENYIRSLPADEGRPPFLIVADVGFCFDIYAEFSRSGGVYLHFPDARTHRIRLDDLEKPEIQSMFRSIWHDPLSLDPSRRSARVTEEVAVHLAELARLLETDGHSPEKVSQFLMRCIFTMFAEDVSLIPANSFTDMLQKAAMESGLYEHFLRDLWTAMNNGTVSVALGRKLLRFNGNIFANPEVLPLTKAQISILLEAAKADWREVEPTIFGTLLERALNPKERHKLGAHYTPRAYVERLVIPTVMQPLRKEWDDVQAAASLLFSQGKTKEAEKTIADFHKRLLAIRILDPACGSGNFLYVTLEHMKRLEGEVLQTLATYGELQETLLQVDPHQFLGLEINPRAAHIAEMVLWIGYLQWHFRTHGNVSPPEPVIRKFENIQCRDALIDWKSRKYATDKNGRPITRWDGETWKTDPATGRHVPDEAATTVDMVYEGVVVTQWPKADFIVGNPPFARGKTRKKDLGYGYFNAISKAYSELAKSCDFVMYWWHKAAELVREGKARQFGFITTNSIAMVFNRRLVSPHLEDKKKPLHLAFAVPDHPWVDAVDGAAVRIAMTVGAKGAKKGVLASVTEERETEGRECFVALRESEGIIHADLRQGTDITGVCPLKANAGLTGQGMKLHGSGFIVTPEEATLLGLGRIPGLERHIRPYRNGRDLADRARNVMVIDLFGLTAQEVRDKYPEVYQWVYTRVKPERNQNNEEYIRVNWWLFGGKNTKLRSALAGLPHYIATVRVAKHHFFVFLDGRIIPDSALVAVASSDPFFLGVLSSRIHVCWALSASGRLGYGNDPYYNNTLCLDPFPFPDATPEQQTRIRDLGKKLDTHRKARQELHLDLTMTGMYNALQALREGRALTAKEKTAHEQGIVAVLRELHDELDAAVADAYGWHADLSDEDILARLVALNAERAEEEKQGKIRWLRPEYQTKSKAERQTIQIKLDLAPPAEPVAKGKKSKTAKAAPEAKIAWPSALLEQTQAVRGVVKALQDVGIAIALEAVAECFTRAPRARVEEILRVLETLGFIAINK